MAELHYTVDQNDLFEGFSSDPVPAGTYKVLISDSEVVTPKSGDGKMVKLQYEILSEEFHGRKLFDNIVIKHSNSTAETIGRQKLNSIAVLCGITGAIKDTAQLHNKVFEVTVGVKKSEEYGLQNTIKKYGRADQEDPFENKVKKPTFVK